MAFLIDTHAHLSLFPEEEIPHILERAKTARVKAIINICMEKKELEQSVRFSSTSPKIFSGAALSPQDVARTDGMDFLASIRLYAREKKLIAIGEAGLDYHYTSIDKELQKQFFLLQMRLAEEESLPLIVHCREAFSDLFLLANKFPTLKVVVHCFTGTKQEAEELLKRGWYLSLSGILTFKNSNALREIAQDLPLERILIETDSPYLAPQTYRGKKNEPSFVSEVAKALGEIKHLSLEEIAQITTDNALSFFSLGRL